MTNKDESELSVSSLNIWSKYRNNFFASSSQREARLGTFLPSWIAILLKKKNLSAAFPNVSALLQHGVIPGVSPEPETIVGLY